MKKRDARLLIIIIVIVVAVVIFFFGNQRANLGPRNDDTYASQEFHFACNDNGRCVRTQGGGPDTCTQHSQCGAPGSPDLTVPNTEPIPLGDHGDGTTQMKIDATLENIGNADAGAFHTSIQIYNTLNEELVAISPRLDTLGLGANREVIVSFTADLPESQNYRADVFTDYGGQIVESNENNNDGRVHFST